MKVSAYSIEKTLFEGDAEKCIAQTSLGEITVLDGHEPLISFIKGGIKIIYKEKEGDILSEKEIDIPIELGFFEVQPPKIENGKIYTEIVALVADSEASLPLNPFELSHKVV